MHYGRTFRIFSREHHEALQREAKRTSPGLTIHALQPGEFTLSSLPKSSSRKNSAKETPEFARPAPPNRRMKNIGKTNPARKKYKSVAGNRRALVGPLQKSVRTHTNI